MRPPAAAGRHPSPLRRREKSPVKQAGESAYPYEHPSSRARPSWRTEPEEDDGFDEDEEEDLYGLEPSCTERSSGQASYTQRSSRQEPLDRRSIEPDGIHLDDDLGEDIDLDTVSRLAYAFSRRSGTQRDPSMTSLRDIGRRGRTACSVLVQSKGKGKYAGIAQVAPLESISESVATSMPRSRPVAFDYRARRADSPPPIPAPMGDAIEADHPFSDTYSAFYLTPLPSLTTTSYSAPLPAAKRYTNHYINRATIVLPHTTAIIIAESANTSPTTTTGTTTTTTTTNPATTLTSTSTTTATTAAAQTHITTILPPAALTPDPPPLEEEDEGFSEPTVVERLAALEREREQAFLAGLSRTCGRVAVRRGVGDLGMDGGGGGREAAWVVRPRVRKRISKRKGGGRDP